MLWFYRILFIPVLIVASPYYIWRMLRRGGYSDGFTQRLGLFPTLPPKSPGLKRIWLQAVSVGEIEAIGPLLRGLQASGRTEVILTTTTSTGYQLARERYPDLCLAIGIFPLDFWLSSSLAWSKILPDIIVLMEGELWPEHLAQAKRRNIPAYLINARLSDKSFARHQKWSRVSQSLFSHFNWIGAGSEEDARRLKSLAQENQLIEMTGNLKFDVSADGPLSAEEKNNLRIQLGFGNDLSTLVLLGSSTWEGEELLLIKTLQEVRKNKIEAKLLLVPRHAERRDSIVKLLQSEGLPYHQRSVNGPVAPIGTLIHLADTTGELRHLTRAADLAFIGKSLAPHEGGQTPVECAAAGVPMVYGPQMTNFKSICDGLESIGVAQKCERAAAVTNTVLAMANHRARLAEQSQTAIAWHKRNQGATQRTLKKLLD